MTETCTAKGCTLPAVDGGRCARHSPHHLRAIAPAGGRGKGDAYQDKRAQVVVNTIDQVRALVARAVALADASAEPACRRATVLLQAADRYESLIKTADLEAELAELRALVDERLGKTG